MSWCGNDAKCHSCLISGLTRVGGVWFFSFNFNASGMELFFCGYFLSRLGKFCFPSLPLKMGAGSCQISVY